MHKSRGHGRRTHTKHRRRSNTRLLIAVVAALACLGLLGRGAAQIVASHKSPLGPGIHVFFSPNGGCTDAIVTEINAARRTVHVEAYAFTSSPIARALVNAARRGVDVEVVLDKSNATDRYTVATFLVGQGIPTYIDAKYAIAHSKNIIIDGATIITGSFNFTKSAEYRNAETLLIIKGFPEVARKFEANFAHEQAESYPYVRKGWKSW